MDIWFIVVLWRKHNETSACGHPLSGVKAFDQERFVYSIPFGDSQVWIKVTRNPDAVDMNERTVLATNMFDIFQYFTGHLQLHIRWVRDNSTANIPWHVLLWHVCTCFECICILSQIDVEWTCMQFMLTVTMYCRIMSDLMLFIRIKQVFCLA